jgi:hypothetical protein
MEIPVGIGDDSMAKWQRPRSELIQHFKSHLRALDASARAYDAGETWEALRLATAVYTLVHDGNNNSISILTQLGIRASLKFVSSSRPLIPGNVLPEHPLAIIRIRGGEAKYISRFHDSSHRPILVQFHTLWSNESIFRVEDVSVSRRRLVFALRNQDGGGHLDPKLNEDGYLLMSRASKRSVYFGSRGKPDVPLLGLELASMRQMAWELTKTLEAVADEEL